MCDNCGMLYCTCSNKRTLFGYDPIDSNSCSSLYKPDVPAYVRDSSPIHETIKPFIVDVPKYEPDFFHKPDLDGPSCEPIRDIYNNVIGNLDPTCRTITPELGGSPLQVHGQFVSDIFGNMVGEMGPGNVLLPPPIFYEPWNP